MKIWSNYGSEHSMDLILIGRFKHARTAEQVEDLINQIQAQVSTEQSVCTPDSPPSDQGFSSTMIDFLNKHKVYTLHPVELGQFLSDYHLKRTNLTITVKTEEVDVSAFIKLFVDAGGKIEVFSGHHYEFEIGQD